MTFHALYRLEASGQLGCPVMGVALDDWSHQELLDAIAAAVRKGGDVPRASWPG